MTIILNGSTGITTPGLDGNAVGTDIQPYDSDLSNLTNLLGPNAYFAKSDPTTVAFTKTGNGTAKLNQLLHVEVNGLILIIAALLGAPGPTARTPDRVARSGTSRPRTPATTSPRAASVTTCNFHRNPERIQKIFFKTIFREFLSCHFYQSILVQI